MVIIFPVVYYIEATKYATHIHTDRRNVGYQSMSLSKKQHIHCVYQHLHTSCCPQSWESLLT